MAENMQARRAWRDTEQALILEKRNFRHAHIYNELIAAV